MENFVIIICSQLRPIWNNFIEMAIQVHLKNENGEKGTMKCWNKEEKCYEIDYDSESEIDYDSELDYEIDYDCEFESEIDYDREFDYEIHNDSEFDYEIDYDSEFE
jgi:hypothetical protein